MNRGTLLIALLAGCTLGLLTAPGLTWLDGGELGAAAWELGIAHPPGAPVFALFTRAIMTLLPFGDIALRGNLASAMLAAACLAMVYQAAHALGARPWAAAAGALLLLATPVFTLHATTIELYAGLGLFTATMVWLTARAATTGDARHAVALGLLIGLAAGHHAELRLLALPLLPMACWRARKHRRAALAVVAMGLLGALVVLYLPIRAETDPLRNWGDPSTPSALWHHLMGTRIRVAFAEQFGTLQPEALTRFGAQLWANPALLLLGLTGLFLAPRRPGGVFIPLLFALDAIYAVSLNPMGLRDLQNGVPGLVALALGAAITLEFVSQRAPIRPALGWAGLATLSALCVVPLLQIPTHTDRGLPALLDAISDDSPPEALVLVASDNLAAGLAFAQVSEGARPDLAVVVRQHIWDASSVAPVARRLPHALLGWQAGGTLKQLTHLKGRWPLRWEGAAASDAADRPALAPRFPLYGRSPAPFEPALRAHLERLPAGALDEPQARRAYAGLVEDVGRLRLDAKAPGAVEAFARAVHLDPSPGRWTNLGTAHSMAGDHRRAVEATRQALLGRPNDRTALRNLTRYLLLLGDLENALRASHQLLTAHPDDADGYGLQGVILGNLKDLPGAVRAFKHALSLDPNQVEARAGMNMLRRPPSTR